MEKEYGENKFKVIDGGLLENATDSEKSFISAFVTNTRFMGVVVIGVSWALTDNTEYTRLHQFFYIDAAESGIENYESILTGEVPDGDEEYVLRKTEISMRGGLGGTKRAITEKELTFLLCSYAKQNGRSHESLPEPESEYDFILKRDADLTQGEIQELNDKLFVSISSPYEAINYFLMRCFEHDYEVAGHLTKGSVSPRLFPQLPPCILIKNTIQQSGPSNGLNESNYCQNHGDDDFATFDTRVTYICKSLVDSTERHFLALTQITMEKYKVISCTPISLFALSGMEATMINQAAEYVTVFDFIGTSEDLEYFMGEYEDFTSVSEYPDGKLYMVFNPDNDHVKKPVYRLDDDVFGAMFVQDYSQIILCSSSLENITAMEQRLNKASLSMLITSYRKYEFHQQVFGEYINSGLEDFEEFLKMVANDYDDFDDSHGEDGLSDSADRFAKTDNDKMPDNVISFSSKRRHDDE